MSNLFENDNVLKKWVNPYYLRPDVIEAIRESSQAKPHCTYAALDNFFNEDVLDAYFEKHRQLAFYPDDPNLPYDSSVVYAEKGKSEGSELFFHEPWHQLLAAYIGTPLSQPGLTGVKQRAHSGDSKGFWIHTDRTERKNAAMAALIYLNKNWKEEEGHLLQLWAHIEHAEPPEKIDYPWDEYGEQRLDFLNERYALTTDLVTSDGLKPGEVFLIDQVTPEYNRLLLVDFIRDPAYHSITPGNGRERFAIVQWLF